MTPYLNRIKAKKSSTPYETSPTKLTKESFVSTVSSPTQVSELFLPACPTLRDGFRAPDALPAGPCPACGCRHYWLAPHGWRCSDCHPVRLGHEDTCTVPP